MTRNLKIYINFSARVAITLLAISYSPLSLAQTATVWGTVRDSAGKPMSSVNIGIVGQPVGTTTYEKGTYELQIPAGKKITIAFSFIGYATERRTVILDAGERREINIRMRSTARELVGVTVEDEKSRSGGMKRINPKNIQRLPNASGNIETILKTLPGVVSNNELTSQYSVRGGNYDENLVYVNDIEIYRPLLIRSGQQEGLSFINSDLVSSILFSAGGFDASYGDKMSSVLDIRYLRPNSYGGSVNMSLLGGGFHVQGISSDSLRTFLIGGRYKSNSYLLKSLDTDGDYKPLHSDIQTYLTQQLGRKTELAYLGNYSRNKYRMIPQTRETEFGNINQALRLKIYFDGQEVDMFETYMSALSLTHFVTDSLRLKFIASTFRTFETEHFDIMGQYWLDELERDFGDPKFGDVAFNRGVGTFLNHARNSLDAWVYNAEHKGYLQLKRHYIQWGTRIQREVIHDRIREWVMLDSADYSLPQAPGDQLLLNEVVITKIGMETNRGNGYIQDTWRLSDSSALFLTVGLRGTYWDENEVLNISPRLIFSVKPDWKRDFLFRFSTGYYHQPPFYRELRDLNGRINKYLVSQQSVHFVAGADYNFTSWKRPFKFVAEIYYKSLDDLVPYKVDNVRTRYYATNNSHGYATGIDLRLNGEFVEGIESWASLSVMKSEEDLEDDYYYEYYNKDGEKIIPGYTFDQTPADSVRFEPGYVARPTDQRVNFSIFFQDYLPKNPDFKMHLNLVFGSGLPFGPPGYDRYKDIFRMPPYRRVDIGFSALLLGENPKRPPGLMILKNCHTIWASLEVFNLLQVNNTVSYLWIKDVTNRQYAVPNYLTARRLNVRMSVEF